MGCGVDWRRCVRLRERETMPLFLFWVTGYCRWQYHLLRQGSLEEILPKQPLWEPAPLSYEVTQDCWGQLSIDVIGIIFNHVLVILLQRFLKYSSLDQAKKHRELRYVLIAQTIYGRAAYLISRLTDTVDDPTDQPIMLKSDDLLNIINLNPNRFEFEKIDYLLYISTSLNVIRV